MTSSLAQAPFGGANASASAARRGAVIDSPLTNARKRADRACALVNWILLAASFGIGWHVDALMPVFVVGLPLALVSTTLALAVPGLAFTRIASGFISAKSSSAGARDPAASPLMPPTPPPLAHPTPSLLTSPTRSPLMPPTPSPRPAGSRGPSRCPRRS